MEAFFAAVEVLRDPSLAGQPLIVGGAGDRGVVASCSYEARAYGIHSAMPSAQARRLCPQAVFVHGTYDAYGEHSRQIHQIFQSFTPFVEGISLDEAFLDVGGSVRLFGPAPTIAAAIRTRIKDVLELDCSVGVATSKLIAKLASKAAKPKASMKGVQPGRGVVVVEPFCTPSR
jgi:DNA polymerase-4